MLPLEPASISVFFIPDEDIALVEGVRKGLAEMPTGNFDFQLDARQTGGHIWTAQRNAYRVGGRMIGHALAGVVQLIGRAGDLDLLAKNLVLAFDDRACALAGVLLGLFGG